jgi:hypothetical protein
MAAKLTRPTQSMAILQQWQKAALLTILGPSRECENIWVHLQMLTNCLVFYTLTQHSKISMGN